MMLREMTPLALRKELEHPKIDRSSRRRMTAHSAAHPAALPPRTGMNFSVTFPSIVMQKARLSSACSVEHASPRPDPSAAINSSHTAYVKVSMTVVAETPRLGSHRRMARPLRLKQERRGKEGQAAECAVDVLTKHQTSTRTSARTEWLSSRRIGPISPSKRARRQKLPIRTRLCTACEVDHTMRGE